MNKNQIVKKSGLYLIGNLSSKVLTVFLLPIYAFYLNAETLGNFDYSQTLVNFLIPLVYLAIWEGILRYVLSTTEKEQIDKILTTTSLFVIIVSVGVFIIIRYFSTVIDYSFYTATMLIVQGASQIWQYYARALKQNIIFVVSGITSTIVNFLMVVILVVILNKGVSGLFLSYILGQLSSFLIIEYKVKVLKSIRIENFDFSILKTVLAFSAPLSINLISSWFMSGYARFFITNNFGAYENGLYSFANKFSQIINILGNVIVMAMIEEAIIAKNSKTFATKFSDMINQIIDMFFKLLLFIIPLILVFYKIVAKTGFEKFIDYVPILLLYSFFMILSSSVGVVFQAKDKTQYQFITTLFSAILTVGSSFIFINMGVKSVIFAQLIGSISLFLSRYILANRYIRVYVDFKKLIFNTLFYLTAIYLSVNLPFILALSVTTVGIMIYIFYHRKHIIIEIKKMKK